MLNNEGPRIDLYGTPNTISFQELHGIFIFALRHQLVK